MKAGGNRSGNRKVACHAVRRLTLTRCRTNSRISGNRSNLFQGLERASVVQPLTAANTKGVKGCGTVQRNRPRYESGSAPQTEKAMTLEEYNADPDVDLLQ